MRSGQLSKGTFGVDVGVDVGDGPAVTVEVDVATVSVTIVALPGFPVQPVKNIRILQ